MTQAADLIDRLIQIQTSLDVKDGTFAKRLNISRQMWSLLRRRVNNPGEKSLAGISVAFPELEKDLSLFLRSRVAFTSPDGILGDDPSPESTHSPSQLQPGA